MTKEELAERSRKLSEANKGSNNPRSRKVICIQDGVVMDCIKDMAAYYGINYGTLKTHIQRKHKAIRSINKTFRYYDEVA